MKVLFAVSNENISEAIIKRYPKEYREILSYKNVYYFNAILKEIQRDKSYDRIVISEDLEPFVNTNHDSIDNFIFEHLDKISDEAHDNDGKETAIILICSERRTPGSAILSKLFSIGVYNAVMGKDRNLTELCKLINRPRTKKEAKIYYRIDQATYDPVVENEVNEVEIQNILTHFKKLGKNTERYADSFNNIAAQYTDEQLRIIINVLPIKVKAVLESESQKYQALMGTSGEEHRIQPVKREPGIKVNTIGKTTQINGPIVIPSGIKKTVSTGYETSGENTARVVRPKVQNEPVVKSNTNEIVVPISQNNQSLNKTQTTPIEQITPDNNPVNNGNSQIIKPNSVKQVDNATTSQIIKPTPVNQVNNGNNQIIKPTPVNKVNNQNININQPTNSIKETTSSVEPIVEQPKELVDNNDNLDGLLEGLNPNVKEQDDETVKRGRGRPKKIVSVKNETVKRGRGRPRKNSIEDTLVKENDNNLIEVEDNSSNILSGFNNESNDLSDSSVLDMNDVLPGMEASTDDIISTTNDESDEVLPGIDNEEDDSTLPGLDDSIEEVILPGFEDSSEEVTLPGFDDETLSSMENDTSSGEEVDVNELLSGLEDSSNDNTLSGLENIDDNNVLSGLEDVSDDVLPGLDNEEDDNTLPGLDDELSEEETILPGMGFEDTVDEPVGEIPKSIPNPTPSVNINTNQNPNPNSNVAQVIQPKINYSMSNLNSLLSKDKKIVTFIGTTKNGTSFLVNNLALMFSLMGIDTAILDITQNRNSYYIFTDSREELRNIAYTSIAKLENGYAEGIKVNKNMTVYTALPADGNSYENAEPILSTLVQNHSLVLIDCDFETPPAYFAMCQEIYLVQSMDILTIQPLTAFLRELKFKGAWEPEKVRVVINKETKVKGLNGKMIIAGMSRYNGPDMSVMTDLFNRDMVKACSIPFDEKVYGKYLETMATCKLSLSGYSKMFMQKMQILGEMVYPRLNSKKSYGSMNNSSYSSTSINANNNVFSNNMNNTLNQMKNKY